MLFLSLQISVFKTALEIIQFLDEGLKGVGERF